MERIVGDGETPEKFLTVYDPIYFFRYAITEGIVTLDIDKATVQMTLDYLNDVAIFTHLERKRGRGMTKWDRSKRIRRND